MVEVDGELAPDRREYVPVYDRAWERREGRYALGYDRVGAIAGTGPAATDGVGWAWLRPGRTHFFCWCVEFLPVRSPIAQSVRALQTRGDGGEPDGWHLGTAQVMHRHPVLDHQLVWEYLGRGQALPVRRCAA